MFRRIFSKETFLAILILWLSEGTPSGSPKWICEDPKGCPIVNNTCPTCTVRFPTLKETPEVSLRVARCVPQRYSVSLMHL